MSIFNRRFTAKELKSYMNDYYPDSFGVGLYEVYQTTDRRLKVIVADYDKPILNPYSHDKKPDNEKFYTLADQEAGSYMDGSPRFPRQRSPIFYIHSGQENSYIDLLLEDEKISNVVMTWGYKRCDVERDYMFELITEIFGHK